MAETNFGRYIVLLAPVLILFLIRLISSDPSSNEKFEIVVGYSGRFYRVELQGEIASKDEEFPNLLIPDSDVNLMARDAKTGDLFVVDNGNKKIIRVSAEDSEDVEVVAEEGIGEISSIVFDKMSESLFWTDKEHRTVQSMSTETRTIKSIHTFPEGDIPLSIVSDDNNRLLFVAVNKSPLKVMKLCMHSHESSYISLLRSHRGPDTWLVDSGDANVAMTIDKKNSVVYVVLGRTIHSFNHKSVNAKVTRMQSNVNQLILHPMEGKFMWTGPDGLIYWDDLKKILRIRLFKMFQRLSPSLASIDLEIAVLLGGKFTSTRSDGLIHWSKQKNILRIRLWRMLKRFLPFLRNIKIDLEIELLLYI